MAKIPKLSDIIAKIQVQRDVISKNFGIEILGIGGSIARGEGRVDSDLDLGVRKVRRISLFEVVDAKEALTLSLGLPVDLIFVDFLPEFKSSVFMRDLVRL
jgi:predicted nucleotidyltransferase